MKDFGRLVFLPWYILMFIRDYLMGLITYNGLMIIYDKNRIKWCLNGLKDRKDRMASK